jgi:outer membrane protein OmpA-like peptidoglycan-associated protein
MLCVLALAGAPAAGNCAGIAGTDPSVDEMIEALAVKPGAGSMEGMRTRGIRPGQGAKAAPPGAAQGKLQLAVQFEFGSATISPASRDVLQRLAGAMKSPALAGLEYRIEGHTDAIGDGAANMRLSERRARAVLDFLKSASGVDAARLTALGMGSARPANPDDPRAAVNRRVVIVSMEPVPVAVASGPKEGAGTVEQVKGELQVRRGPSSSVLQAGARVREGDVLTTAENASALVRLDDGANLLLRASSVLRVAKLRLTGDPSKWSQAFDLVVGAFRYVTGALGGNRPDAIAFSTAMATVGIRGTDIDVVHKPERGNWGDVGTYVKVNKGAAAVGGLDGSKVELGKLEQAFAGEKKPVTRGGTPMPAAVRLKDPAGVFATGDLDEILEAR